MSEFYTTLSIINFTYLLLSVSYSWQIYLAPSPHGWTFVSVMVGTSYLIFAMMFNLFVCYHYGQMTVINLLLIPVATLAAAGLPMAAGQLIKKMHEDKKNDELIDGEHLD